MGFFTAHFVLLKNFRNCHSKLTLNFNKNHFNTPGQPIKATTLYPKSHFYIMVFNRGHVHRKDQCQLKLLNS